MKSNSIITIVNNQIMDSEHSNMKFIVNGVYSKKNGKYYIAYRENKNMSLNKSEEICIVKVENPTLVTITKLGAEKSGIILERGKRHYSQYATAYGFLNMGVYTDRVDCILGKSGAKIRLRYSMDINSSIVSYNEINIDVKKKGE